VQIFATIAWGVGLTALGAVIIHFGLRLVRNSRGLAEDWYWSWAVSRPRLLDREPRTFGRVWGGVVMTFGALCFAIGVYALIAGLLLI